MHRVISRHRWPVTWQSLWILSTRRIPYSLALVPLMGEINYPKPDLPVIFPLFFIEWPCFDQCCLRKRSTRDFLGKCLHTYNENPEEKVSFCLWVSLCLVSTLGMAKAILQLQRKSVLHYRQQTANPGSSNLGDRTESLPQPILESVICLNILIFMHIPQKMWNRWSQEKKRNDNAKIQQNWLQMYRRLHSVFTMGGSSDESG